MADAETISITVCGDGGCGKSSITLRLVRSQWTHEYDPTIEDSYSVTRTVDGLPYFLALTDTAGQEEYRGLWASTNLRSDAFLLVYDITNESTLETLDYFMEMIDIEAEHRRENNARLIEELWNTRMEGDEPVTVGMAPPVKFVAGNKCDLKDSRIVTSRKGLEWARKRGCGFMETSAREMVNIEETFALIVRRVVEGRRQHRLEQLPQAIQQFHLSPNSPSQHLFPPSLFNSPQAISHSRTPALTAYERKLTDSVDGREPVKDTQERQWLDIGKALSKRVARLKKSSLTALRGGSGGCERPSDEGEIEKQEDNNKPPERSKSVSHAMDNNAMRDYADQQQINEEQEQIKASWWKRVLCA